MQYLGSTVVKELRGTESTKKSIQKLKSAEGARETPEIMLAISYRGVKFLEPASQELVCEHEVRNIHCACQDSDDLTHFAYITKDHLSNSHFCHVFFVTSMVRTAGLRAWPVCIFSFFTFYAVPFFPSCRTRPPRSS